MRPVALGLEWAPTARRRLRWLTGERGARPHGLLFGLTVIAAMLISSFVSPLFLKYSPTNADPFNISLPPSWDHPFGTDDAGFDILARVLYAPRVDLLIALVATLGATFVGVALGLMAGTFEGWGRVRGGASYTTMRAMDIFQSFPVFILALALVAGGGRSATNVVIALIFVNIPVFVRLTRSEVLRVRERAHVDAAFLVGASRTRIALRHVLPLSVGPVLIQFSVTAGFAILLTAGLSFVGAGIRPPTPEWGLMISSGAPLIITGSWWPSVFPGVFLGIAVFALALIGDAARRLPGRA